MNEALHERARRANERAVIRAWEYRQRHHAKGVWFRFRRALADAAEAWILSEGEAALLEKRGHAPLPVGLELVPPKRLFFLSRKELEAISERRLVRTRLSTEVLLAGSLALIAHAGIETTHYSSTAQARDPQSG